MTTRTDAPTGAPIWVDIQTTDAAGARSFYGQIFGWEAEEPDERFGGYFTFLKGSSPVAGCSGCEPDSPMANLWMTYLASPDAHATVDTARRKGAEVLVPAMDVAELGTMAVVGDAAGAMVGVWQPKEHRGFLRYNEDGTPGWFDLETRSYAANVQFYRDVFKWTTSVLSDTDECRYTTFTVGDEQLAGIMDAEAHLPADAPISWTVVYRVDDADKSVALIEELGGTVGRPAHDSPYGRLATVADPSGARFALISAT
jgi:predicted enzyme related to lactoylglutathione lyase